MFDDLGLAGTLASFDLNRRGTNTSAQGDDLLALRHLAALQPDPAAFAGWLRRELERPPDPAGVTLATVHRVKGQEWPFVVVHLADADQFPHRLAEDVEEERRLFHVALTRTSADVVVVTTSRPSPFIRELTEEPSARDLVATPRTGRCRVPPAPPRPSAPGRDVFVAGSVIAGPGLVLVDQGQEWTVESVDGAAATALAGGATRVFRFGRKVATSGKQRGDLAPPPPVRAAGEPGGVRPAADPARPGPPGQAGVHRVRRRHARTDRARPADDAPDLARVKGIGPAKLEQYGDAVVDVVNSDAESSSTTTHALEAAGRSSP